jgi:hypothetical protein
MIDNRFLPSCKPRLLRLILPMLPDDLDA